MNTQIKLTGRQRGFYYEVKALIKKRELGYSAFPKDADCNCLKKELTDLAKKNGARIIENETEIGIMSYAFYNDIYLPLKAKQN